jgi:hypothetical protein
VHVQNAFCMIAHEMVMVQGLTALSRPYTYQWPGVPQATQNSIWPEIFQQLKKKSEYTSQSTGGLAHIDVIHNPFKIVVMDKGHVTLRRTLHDGR